MARILKRKSRIAAVILVVLAVSMPWMMSRATTYYSKESTGYAYGSFTGASGGGQLTIGHFANHSTMYCPEDPAASWQFGTWITAVSPAPIMVQGDGSWVQPTSYMLKDIGDSICRRDHYWVDFYFGRYKMPPDPCSCGNQTEVCYETTAPVNNCSDASSWGLVYINYEA